LRIFVSRVKCNECNNETIIAHTDKEAICPICKSKCSVQKVLYEPQTPFSASVSDSSSECVYTGEANRKKIETFLSEPDLFPKNNN
jgi:hypothetical protein